MPIKVVWTSAMVIFSGRLSVSKKATIRRYAVGSTQSVAMQYAVRGKT